MAELKPCYMSDLVHDILLVLVLIGFAYGLYKTR